MRFVFSWLSQLKRIQIFQKGGGGCTGGDSLTLFTWGKFCSLPVGQHIRIQDFFGSDLHLDLCAVLAGAPPPPPCERRPIQSLSLKLFQKQHSCSVSNTNTPNPQHSKCILFCYQVYLWRSTLQTLPVSHISWVCNGEEPAFQPIGFALQKPYGTTESSVWFSSSGKSVSCPTLALYTMDWEQACDFDF